MLAVVRFHRNFVAGFQTLQHRLQTVLRYGEQHGDRFHLRNHHDAGGVARTHDVALIHLTQPKLAGNRRGHARVTQLQPRAIDLTLIDLHGTLKLAHQRLLTAHLLLGDRILLEQHAIALQINARIGEQGLIALHLPFGLQQLRLK